MSMSFAEYLDATMKARGFQTTAALSRATGIGDSVLSKWLTGNGGKTPRTYMLRRLAPALRVPLIELVVAAKIMTPDEAGLEREPAPPAPLDVDSILDKVPGTDKLKEEMRGELMRLIAQAREDDTRTTAARQSRRGAEGSEGSRRSA